jgi:phosphatidate cytidylyltransferase
MSNLIARLLVGLIAAPAIIALLWLVQPLGFFLLIFGAAIVCILELSAMVAPGDRISAAVMVLVTATTSIVVYGWSHDPRAVMTLFAVVPLIGLALPLFRLGEIKTAAFRATSFAFGPVYCAVPLALLAVLRRDFDPGWVILSLLLSWLGDTGGYFAGKYLGKHKLYEAVSPKKTVEGAIGSLFGSLFGAVLASLTFLNGHFSKGHLPLAHAVPLALIGGALGQMGDLAESLLKRSTGIKDSGAILPGHGGMLDRLDALMYTATIVFLYNVWR